MQPLLALVNLRFTFLLLGVKKHQECQILKAYVYLPTRCEVAN